MGTLDDDMAQEGDIAELQENFNEDVEQNIQMDHLRQEKEELLEISKKQTEEIKNLIKATEDVKQKTKDTLGKTVTKKEILDLGFWILLS